MNVRRAVGRSFAIAAATLALGGLADVVYQAALCPKARLADRAARHEPVTIDSGYRFAVPGEVILACTTTHRLGPITLHEDFGCYCAPEGADPSAVGGRLGGRCTVDHAAPHRSDASGICRHAHCEDIEE